MVGIHSSFFKGSKIRIIFCDGTQIIAKFIDKLGQERIKTDKGIINMREVRSANYYKPLAHER